MAYDPITFVAFDPLSAAELNQMSDNDDYFNTSLEDGWVAVSDSWSYASSTTITVPSDATAKYQIGDFVRLKQGGGYKYFRLKTVASTLLTVETNTTYTVANSSITDIWFSRVRRPLGLPSEYTEYVSRTLLGSTTSTSLSQTFSTTITNLTGMSVTVTVPDGGRQIRITGKVRFNNATTNDVGTLFIRESTTVLDGFEYNFVSNGRDMDILVSTILTPSAGSHTYVLSGQTSTGTGNITWKSSSTAPAYILVEMI